MTAEFSVIIPHHGNIKLLRDCVNSLLKHEQGRSFEIIIVDDGSDPLHQIDVRAFAAAAPHTKCILRSANTGFAATVNAGLAEAVGKYLILCNNDIVFTQPVLLNFKDTFERHPEVGIVGSLLLYPNKRVQHAGLVYIPGQQSFIHEYKYKQLREPAVQKERFAVAVTGALFGICRSAYQVLGPLNSKYFLACEDTEYCLRAWSVGWQVLYTPNVRATHLEGATRGQNVREKQVKGRQWFRQEKSAIKQFKTDLLRYDLERIQKTVSGLNGGIVMKPKIKKLEVGSGFNPHPGYLHLDVRAGLPDIDYVCDITKKPLPFADGTLTEILANHVIEHISFRQIPFVVKEWARVLEDGGKLVLRTPDLRFICEKYLRGETTPEWPGDENYVKEHLAGAVTPAWWANIKLFSGQDYDANFHHVCFDFSMLRELLEKYGFSNVQRVKFPKEFSPGELQIEARKGGRKTALVIRRGALGDVLLTAPIVERLAKDYQVYVATDSPQALEGNPHVHQVMRWDAQLPYQYSKVVNLDLAYEKTPRMHIIDAYSMAAFGDTNTPHQCTLRSAVTNPDADPYICPYICMHMGVGWRNRTWPEESWHALAKLLADHTVYNVVVVGAGGDFKPPPHHSKIHNYVNGPNFEVLLANIKDSSLFIGPDSGLLHLAQALDVPAVGLFTCAKPEYRVHSKRALAVVPDIDCAGCLHDETPPVTFCGCRRGDYKCLDLITPEIVFNRVREILNDKTKRDDRTGTTAQASI